ncbi:MAG: peptidylprolyl isomerase [Acidobacteriota bacterium]
MTSSLLVSALLALALAPGEPASAPAAAPRVALDTSMGRIVIELNAQKAPKTVDNFLAYVKAGFYDGTVFHRVIPGFMVQGGGFTAAMQQKPTRPAIVNESSNGLANLRGSVAMARLPQPDSATAQFFINLVNNSFLDYPRAQGSGYAVFGNVVEGMDVVDKIAKVATATKDGMQNVPTEPVVIKKASVVTK